VLLLVGAAALFFFEVQTEGFGLLGVLALAAVILGSLLLFSPFSPSSPALPAVQVSPWVIGLVTLSIAAFFLLVVRALVRARRTPLSAGSETLIGQPGVALSELAPRGTVRVDTEEWSADSEDGAIHPGEPVRVVGVHGVTLRVKRQEGGTSHPREGA